MERDSIFLSYVRLTLKNWAGFQAAIEEGMGGPYAKEKEVWLGTEIAKYFKLYSDVKPSDMEDYLGEMLENEFDTYFEDGSLLEVSKHLCEVYKLSLINPTASIFEVLRKDEKAYSSNQSSQIKGVNTEGFVTVGMEQLAGNGIHEEGWTVVDTADEEEWTLVTRKGFQKSSLF